MQRPLFVHGVTIVIGDETGTLLSDGALAVADDRIAALGRAAHVLARHATAERIEIQGQAGDVEAVMVDGRWIMRDGRVLTLDEASIIVEAERVARTAWARLFAERPELRRPPGFAV